MESCCTKSIVRFSTAFAASKSAASRWKETSNPVTKRASFVSFWRSASVSTLRQCLTPLLRSPCDSSGRCGLPSQSMVNVHNHGVLVRHHNHVHRTHLMCTDNAQLALQSTLLDEIATKLVSRFVQCAPQKQLFSKVTRGGGSRASLACSIATQTSSTRMAYTCFARRSSASASAERAL